MKNGIQEEHNCFEPGDGMPEHHTIHCLPMDAVYCKEHASELETMLQELNTLFSAVGTKITVEDSILTIDVHEEKFALVTKRKAGRKAKDCRQQYEEIMEYRKTHTAMETAEWLGLTKQTYYRRMKELKEQADAV